MAFSDGRWLLSRFSWVLACSHLPPGILYEPNMIEEQNEEHKPLPKRIQEHASARKKREETEENAKKRLLASHPYKLG